MLLSFGPLQNQPSEWVRYVWDLSGRSWDRFAADILLPAELSLREGRPADAEAILRVVIDAYGSDPTWLPMLPGIAERMRARIAETIGSTSSIYFLIEHEGSIAGVSGVAQAHSTDQNLLTGICVLPEFQRRRIGRALLFHSLMWLRKRGLPTAQVYTHAGSLADRKMYPLFGSRRITNVIYPGVQGSNSP